jgi:flagellar biosynthesis/type III secretory pathway chaperone
MDPQLQALGAQLAESTVRNTAGMVADKIRAVKARKEDRETIAELEDIVSSLLSDKSELVRIAQAYEQELVAQQISGSDIAYITDNILPVLSKLMQSAAADKVQGTAPVEAMLEVVRPILSAETVTIFQLLGFNFRKAIGEPLTLLVGQLISSKSQGSSTLGLEVQRLALMRDLAYLEVAKDPESSARLARITGQQ